MRIVSNCVHSMEGYMGVFKVTPAQTNNTITSHYYQVLRGTLEKSLRTLSLVRSRLPSLDAQTCR